MSEITLIKATPWDTAVFGVPTWELLEYSPAALLTTQTAGHYTIRVDPLVDKRLLHEFEFYYCDTLIEPRCDAVRLRSSWCVDATISKDVDTASALSICHGAFSHGRFHRDFNLSYSAADLRYDNWLKQLLDMGHVYGLYWRGEMAGFIGCRENNLILHALSEKYRGKGLSKYWWTALCIELFRNGYQTITSSVSTSNAAVVNLYASLGFSFYNPQDIYHRFVR